MEDFGVKSNLAGMMIYFLLSEIWIAPMLDYNPLLFMYLSAFGVVLLAVHIYFLRRRVNWEVYCQHLCVARDGVRYVKDKRKSYWGWACTNIGKTSKTVPLDKITDCDIQEPVGMGVLGYVKVFCSFFRTDRQH
mmetsp:Transcript_17831/g.25382  ORF Transcript_17831/g.25382 Transcript_17831/m.25382 type:complete len:134 (+) Transcript_17831:126-527(+)